MGIHNARSISFVLKGVGVRVMRHPHHLAMQGGKRLELVAPAAKGLVLNLLPRISHASLRCCSCEPHTLHIYNWMLASHGMPTPWPNDGTKMP